MFVPTKAFLTKGVGRHREKLTSFEMALRDAHLANFNLVRVSSIFPPHCELVDREEGLSLMQPGQVVFAVIAESSTNEPSRLVAASIGVAMPADPTHHGYISEHHSYGQNEVTAGEYAEDLAASMLATVLGVPFDSGSAWDERREQWLLSGEVVRTMNVTSTALGATASALGVLLLRSQVWIGRIGGVVVVLFGLYLLGILRPAFLMRERRLELAHKPLGYLGSALVGVTFGAAWTPCIGPILGAILTLAAAQASVAHGTALLGIYALGLAIPFVITALALDRFLAWFQRFRPYIVWVDRIAGALLVLLGILLVTDRFTLLAGWLQGLTPEFLKSRL